MLDQNSLGPLLWLHKDAVTELKKENTNSQHTQMTQVTNLKKKKSLIIKCYFFTILVAVVTKIFPAFRADHNCKLRLESSAKTSRPIVMAGGTIGYNAMYGNLSKGTTNSRYPHD